jgi:hypothetical protein
LKPIGYQIKMDKINEKEEKKKSIAKTAEESAENSPG